MIYQRSTKSLIKVPEYGERKLKFFYSTIIGRMLLKILVSKTYSRLNAKYNHSAFSLRKIDSTIHKYSINTAEFQNDNFESFSDFFNRELKPLARPYSTHKQDLISVADAKLTYYKITKNLKLKVKGTYYTLGEIINDDNFIKAYAGGTCLIYRLTMSDCHHYIFPDSGKVLWAKQIPGVLHTVQPIAHQKYKPYARNNRTVSCLKTENFDEIIYVEIGALLVGAICNNNKKVFAKGNEKGHFELGGSTIILLLKPGAAQIDDDIIQYSFDGVETEVKQGETIGKKHV